jgi:choline monooxygenase
MSEHLDRTLATFDDTLPLESAKTIPGSWYVDPEVATLEEHRVFARSWQFVGRTAQVAKPGDFLTAQIANEPIVVVRGEDGQLRAFLNVCRHRAARVAIEPCGHATKLRCRYHGWTYDLQGKLRGVPEFDGVQNFKREDNGLTPVHVETWGPLVFVHVEEPRMTLAEWLAPLPERVPSAQLAALHFFERREYELACNWKVFVDNYLDGGYHVHTIHPGLSGVLDYAGYHTELHRLTSVQISPMRVPDESREDASAATVRKGDAAYYWWIFPNLMINVYEGIMDTNLVLPLGPDRCRVIFDFFFNDVATAEAQRFNAESTAVGHQIQLEDVGICEDVQRGVKSRSYEAGRFSVRREAGVYHFHRLLAASLRKMT